MNKESKRKNKNEKKKKNARNRNDLCVMGFSENAETGEKFPVFFEYFIAATLHSEVRFTGKVHKREQLLRSS